MLNKILAVILFISFITALSFATASVGLEPQSSAKANANAKTNANEAETSDEDSLTHLRPKGGMTQQLPIDIKTIEQITGIRDHEWIDKHKVFKLFIPRHDMGVTIDGVKTSPEMGLISWVAFKQSSKKLMLIGDLILSENQVNPVMDVLLNNGFKITSLTNSFLWDNPKVMNMHIEATGNEESLSMGVAKVLVKLKENPGNTIFNNKNKRNNKYFISSNRRPGRYFLPPELIQKLDKILGVEGYTDTQFYKMILSRTTRLRNEPINGAMGINTWATFTGTESDAYVNGDFVVYESELQEVLKTLRDEDIKVTGIQQHMIGEKPRVLFVHFWGSGSMEDLAESVRAVLDETDYKPTLK